MNLRGKAYSVLPIKKPKGLGMAMIWGISILNNE